jgi:hypothetical protein
MSNVRVQINSDKLKRLNKKLDNIPGNMRRKVWRRAASSVNALFRKGMRTEIKRSTTERTGSLRKKWHNSVKITRDKEYLIANTGPTRFYARFLNDGTKRGVVARKFGPKAFQKNVNEAENVSLRAAKKKFGDLIK